MVRTELHPSQLALHLVTPCFWCTLLSKPQLHNHKSIHCSHNCCKSARPPLPHS